MERKVILEKEIFSGEKMFFEDLEPHVQEIILDLIVSVVKNRITQQKGDRHD